MVIIVIETFDIAGYCRISVDEELDRDNTSIENQKAIIEDFVKEKFPGSSLTFFEDRDRSGYTFEQREGYQRMRRGLLNHTYDILVVKDFSRFSRRNSRGLVELEDLRDAGVRIISIGDGIDFPNDDDWLKICQASSERRPMDLRRALRLQDQRPAGIRDRTHRGRSRPQDLRALYRRLGLQADRQLAVR